MKSIIVALLLLATPAGATLTIYADRASFNAANPGLPVETFESAHTGTQAFTGPLSNTTSNASFQPGDILPGITFSTLGGPLLVAGPGLGANPTTALGNLTSPIFPDADSLLISPGPGVTAIAFDYFCFVPTNGPPGT